MCLQCRRPQFDSWVRKIRRRRDRLLTLVFLGFAGDSAGKESACNVGDLGWEDPLEKEKTTYSNILAWRIPWSPWSHKELDMTEQLSLSLSRASLVVQSVKNLSGTQETWVQSLGQEDPLEKGMATHSSILAWRTLWLEEPGGYSS